MKMILETKDLCKRYKKQEANHNISISVQENSVYGILGPRFNLFYQIKSKILQKPVYVK